MREGLTAEQTLALSTRALELLAQHGVLPSPTNYELWFFYAAQENGELVAALDQAVSEGKAGDPLHARTLHARFFGPAAGEAIEEISAQLTQEVTKLAQALERAGADTSDYGRALKTAGDALSGGDPGPQLKTILATVTAATRAMEARTKSLEQQLASSADEVSTLRGRMETIRKESLSDALTGLANRRCFDDQLRRLAAEAAARAKSLSIVMGDVDHFKRFNDTWGHAVGDQVLRLVAQCFKANVRESDVAARFGGEEFVVILPGTSLDEARAHADRIRISVETKKIISRATGQSLGSVTLSLGVAEFVPGEAVADLVNRADACLYAAKRAGRNRVVAERELVTRGIAGGEKPVGAGKPPSTGVQRSKESYGFEYAVRALCRGGSLPMRSAIDLRHFHRFAHWMVIAEPLVDQRRILLRLVGSGFYDFFGRDLTDSDYLELADPAIRTSAYNSALALINQPCGLWQITPASGAAGGADLTFEYTAFPIIDDDRGVRQVIAFVNHSFADAGGASRVTTVRASTTWQWIDLGLGVPDMPVAGAAA